MRFEGFSAYFCSLSIFRGTPMAIRATETNKNFHTGPKTPADFKNDIGLTIGSTEKEIW